MKYYPTSGKSQSRHILLYTLSRRHLYYKENAIYYTETYVLLTLDENIIWGMQMWLMHCMYNIAMISKIAPQ